MSKTKYKTTPFARFFFFMLIFLPLGYLGLSFAKGHNVDFILQSITNKVTSFKSKLNDGGNEDFQAQIILKDAEIQELREELFKCQNK